MKKERMLEIANEVTTNHLGSLDNFESEVEWERFRDGVVAGLIEMLGVYSDVLNEADSISNRPQRPDKLKQALNELYKYMGVFEYYDEN